MKWAELIEKLNELPVDQLDSLVYVDYDGVILALTDVNINNDNTEDSLEVEMNGATRIIVE